MKIRKGLITLALVVTLGSPLTAGACDNGRAPVPSEPVVPEAPDGEGDCDLGDLLEGDEDCNFN